MVEGQFLQPFVQEAHTVFHRELKPRLPDAGKTNSTAVLEHDDRLYHAIETSSRDVGTSIPHLIQLNEASKYAGTPVQFTRVYIEEEGGKKYQLEGHPQDHTWTITDTSDSGKTYALNIEDTGPFVVGHPFAFVHKGSQGESITTRKIKHIKILDTSKSFEVPKLGSAHIEQNRQIAQRIHAIKIDHASPEPEHVQRTIKIYDNEHGVSYMAGYRQHERHEGLHMHASRNDLEVVEGYFEVAIFDRNSWTWVKHGVYGPGSTFHLEPNTPHLVTPAHQPWHPHRLNIIKITTDRPANIDIGQGYNIPLGAGDYPPLPSLEHHFFRRAS